MVRKYDRSSENRFSGRHTQTDGDQPRMGYALWVRVAAGINEPWMCLKIAKEEEVEVANAIQLEPCS